MRPTHSNQVKYFKVIHNAHGDVGRHVATIDGINPCSIEDALEYIFQITNNITTPWIDNEEVQATFEVQEKGRCRSTSVGDWVVAVNEDETESHWACEMFGWSEKEPYEFVSAVAKQKAWAEGYL